jgi:hypothetical protein
VKQKNWKIVTMMLVSMASMMVFGCGSSSDDPPPPPVNQASLTVSSTATTIAPGQDVGFVATFNSTDGTQTDVSAEAVFNSSDVTVGTFPAGTGKSTFSALKVGTTRVTADYNGFQGALDIQVTGTAVSATFVNAATGNDTTGDGTAAAPYRSITKASTEAATNETINVAAGNYTDTFTLKDGQKLVGGSFVTAQATAGTRPVITGKVTMKSGNTVKGFEFAVGSDHAIEQTTGGIAGTIEECIFQARNAGVSEVQLNAASGTWMVKSNTINHAQTSTALSVSQAGSKLSLKVQDNLFATTVVGGKGLVAVGDQQLVAEVTNNTFTGFDAGDAVINISTILPSGVFCLNIRGNKGSGRIDLTNSGTMEVEEAANSAELAALNAPLTASIAGTITKVAAGACAAKF